ncbi:GNAT family N-acetyltransferase [Streptomyces sp. NPDC002004]
MTTTLRPTEPIRTDADGRRSRHFHVCVNSRPVGEIRVSTHHVYGPGTGVLGDLRIEERDRRRGRGTVAALAAEEVARGWGCTRLEASVPAGAEAALRLVAALGYAERSRNMEKHLTGRPPALPAGSLARPLTQDETGPWQARSKELFVAGLVERGVPEAQAHAKADADHAALLPGGMPGPDTLVSVLEHEGVPVGTLWLSTGGAEAYVYDVQVEPSHRGRGHGRTLMLLAEAQALAAGKPSVGLHVFAGNTPALRLYDSLGYVPTEHHFFKGLL